MRTTAPGSLDCCSYHTLLALQRLLTLFPKTTYAEGQKHKLWKVKTISDLQRPRGREREMGNRKGKASVTAMGSTQVSPEREMRKSSLSASIANHQFLSLPVPTETTFASGGRSSFINNDQKKTRECGWGRRGYWTRQTNFRLKHQCQALK